MLFFVGQFNLNCGLIIPKPLGFLKIDPVFPFVGLAFFEIKFEYHLLSQKYTRKSIEIKPLLLINAVPTAEKEPLPAPSCFTTDPFFDRKVEAIPPLRLHLRIGYPNAALADSSNVDRLSPTGCQVKRQNLNCRFCAYKHVLRCRDRLADRDPIDLVRLVAHTLNC